MTWITHVTGDGGGFLVIRDGNGYGQVNPRWTRPDHINPKDFWVRTDDGRKVNYGLEGFDEVAIRQGPAVTVLVANGHVAQIINRTIRMRYRVATLDDFPKACQQRLGVPLLPWDRAAKQNDLFKEG